MVFLIVEKKGLKVKESHDTLVANVVRLVCEANKVSEHELDRAGKKELLLPRRTIAYILRREFNLPLRVAKEGARFKGDLSIYTACSDIGSRLKNNEELKSLVNKIKTETLSSVVLDTSLAKPVEKPTQKPITIKTNSDAILRAVAKVCCTSRLLTSNEPVVEITWARDVAAFLLWRDAALGIEEIAKILCRDADNIHSAIGRITVCQRDNRENLDESISEIMKYY